MATKFLNGVDLVNQKVINLSDPSAGTDAATKQYVDNVARGMHWKAAVRAASVNNRTLATDVANGQLLDGVTLATGDRVLLKDQTNAVENGIYVVAATGAPSRAADFASGASADGVAVTVSEGTENGDLVFIQTEDGVVVGTDELTFSQLGGGGVSYTAGDGLTLSGAQFNVGQGNGIAVGSNAVSASGNADKSVVVESAGIGVTVDPAGGIEHNGTSGLRVLAGTNLERTSGTGALRIAAGAAGNGLTGGGTSPLAVGAGNGITVAADSVSIAATVAGAGLTHTSGVIDVAAGSGITTSGDVVAVDPSYVVRKYATNVPSGATTHTITHNLNTEDVTILVKTGGSVPQEIVHPDIYVTGVNTIRLDFAVATTTNQYRVIVHG